MSSVGKFGNSKGSNRHSLDIVRDMLLVASIKVNQTKIMYQANLSYGQVKKYLRDLLEKGLLDYDGRSHFLITKKGLEFIRLYNEYIERRTRLEEQANQSLKKRQVLEEMCFGRKCNSNTDFKSNYKPLRNNVFPDK